MFDKGLLTVILSILTSLNGKSSKKGLCIPPGTNFHCGDLAAFDDVRWLPVLSSVLFCTVLCCTVLHCTVLQLVVQLAGHSQPWQDSTGGLLHLLLRQLRPGTSGEDLRPHGHRVQRGGQALDGRYQRPCGRPVRRDPRLQWAQPTRSRRPPSWGGGQRVGRATEPLP